MQLHPYVIQLQDQLSAAAALGDDRTRETAAALAAAAEPAMRLALLHAVSSAADEITAALLDFPGAPAVTIRLEGDDLQVEVRTATSDVPPPAPVDDGDASARISLRLSDGLKADIDAAARRASVSANTWLLRAATLALAGAAPGAGQSDTGARKHSSNTHHITGWVNG